MIHLTLIRHGETDWNRNRLIQGTTDIPLNDTGRRQARDVALRWSAVLAEPAAAYLVTSDLSRASETAQIISHHWGSARPRPYSALRERAYGDAEGVSTAEFARRWGDWYSAEVPGAESRTVLRDRAMQALATVVADARADRPDVTRVFAVTHGAFIRSVIDHISDGTLPPRDHRLPNGSDYTLRVSEHQWSLADDIRSPTLS